MAFVTGRDVGQMVLEALGLAHQNVRRIVVDVHVNDVVTVYVQHAATEEQADALCGALAEARKVGEVDVVDGPVEVSLAGGLTVESDTCRDGHDWAENASSPVIPSFRRCRKCGSRERLDWVEGWEPIREVK